MQARRLPLIWSYRDGFKVLLCFIVVLLSLTAAHMLWVKYFIGFDAYFDGQRRMPPSLLIVSQSIKVLAIFIALGLVALHWRGLRWEVLGVRTCRPRWVVLAMIAALLGFVLSLLLAKWMVHRIPEWARHISSRYNWQDAAVWQMSLLLLFSILLTPIAEELFFRGFLLRWMASHRPVWLAILVSSLMFGASHIIPSQMIVASLMSLLLIVLFLYSHSIWPSIVCHCLYNALGVLLGLAASSGYLPAWLTPPG